MACGQCHDQEYQDYITGVHGSFGEKAKKDAPICINCHVEHEAERDNGIKNPRAYAAQKCISCHQSARLIRTFKYPRRRWYPATKIRSTPGFGGGGHGRGGLRLLPFLP